MVWMGITNFLNFRFSYKIYYRPSITNVFSFQNMPIFGDPSSPYDDVVEKATADTMTSENWTMMFDICDRVTAEGPRACKQCLLSVRKRLNHRDPHVVLLALALLDCLWNNCGTHFRREVSSKDFVGELNYKCTNSNRIVAERARSLVKKWAKNECAKDSSLSLVESLYKDLQDQGLSFEPDPANQKKKTTLSNDPNVVSSEQEEADIAKAIALSLHEGGKQQQFTQNFYPSATVSIASRHLRPTFTAIDQRPITEFYLQFKLYSKIIENYLSGTPNELSKVFRNLGALYKFSIESPIMGQQEKNCDFDDFQMPITAAPSNKSQSKKVKALYDFEAAEDNELSFLAGELIIVYDDSDQNWWRGSTERSGGASGLFPASFVTEDLQLDNEQIPNEPCAERNGEGAETLVPKVQIDENVLLKCIELLEKCDPGADPSTDPTELPFLEQMAKAQAPLIDQKLVKIDKQLNMLAEVDIAIREVLTAYDTAVQQVAMPMPFSSPSAAPLVSSAVLPPSSYPTASVSSTTSPSYPPHWAHMNGQWPQQQSQNQ